MPESESWDYDAVYNIKATPWHLTEFRSKQPGVSYEPWETSEKDPYQVQEPVVYDNVPKDVYIRE